MHECMCCLDVNIRSTLGATPLHYAASRGRLPMVELLISAGAGPSREVRGGCAKGLWVGFKRPCDLSRGRQMGAEVLIQVTLYHVWVHGAWILSMCSMFHC